MTSCVFCDIISRKIPGKIIFENKKTLAFLSNKADVSGHILIIPKDHCTNLNDITDENFIELQPEFPEFITREGQRLTPRIIPSASS